MRHEPFWKRVLRWFVTDLPHPDGVRLIVTAEPMGTCVVVDDVRAGHTDEHSAPTERLLAA